MAAIRRRRPSGGTEVTISKKLLATSAAATGAMLVLPIFPAAAAPEARGHVLVDVVDVDDTFVEEDFCDVEGLTVEVHDVVQGRVSYTLRGRDAIPYYTSTFHTRSTFTESDGTTVTITSNGVDKDQRVVVNADGTFTVTARGAGGFKVVGPNGTLRDPGMIRVQFVVDTMGTPQNPEDDVVIEELGPIGESTGLNELGEDFCADYLLLTGRA